MTFDIEVKFIDGSSVTIEVEADSPDDALNAAMPTEFRITGESE
ncbi:hypothetical protein [Metabacillus sp. SLBN-84]